MVRLGDLQGFAGWYCLCNCQKAIIRKCRALVGGQKGEARVRQREKGGTELRRAVLIGNQDSQIKEWYGEAPRAVKAPKEKERQEV